MGIWRLNFFICHYILLFFFLDKQLAEILYNTNKKWCEVVFRVTRLECSASALHP